jgi:general stress protein 26
LLKILNANPGIGAPLNEQETKNFLSASKLNMHLGTVDEKGDANVHPAWYFYDPSKDKIYVETSKQSKKTHNLRKKENVYF